MRRLSCSLALLLLAALSLPNAAKASGDSSLRPSPSPAPLMTPAGSTSCKADLQPGIQGALFLSSGNNCGSCSDRFCQGSAIGNACAGGLYYTCQPAYGNNCTDDPTLWQCICWPPGTPFP